MTAARPTLTLGEIEGAAKNYRQARELLGSRVRQLTDQIEAAKRHAEPLIRTALQAAKAAESELTAAIVSSPGLFKKPRTQIFHGVRVGIEKGKGKVEIANPDKCVELIEKHLEDQFDLLVKTKYTLIKKAIQNLPAADLKRIGVQLLDTGDQVVVRPVDSELDKMLDALLKAEATEVSEDE